MKKMVYIDSQEIERYQNIIQELRNSAETVRKDKAKTDAENKFLKDSGEEILVIVKDAETNSTYEYKSNEKILLNELVSENKSVRDKYDQILRENDNIKTQNQLMIMKYHEMENHLKDNLSKSNKYTDWLEQRGFFSRLINSLKDRTEETITEFGIDISSTQIKTIYTKSEMLRLEEEVKSIKKPRGWHFKEEFMDSDGNVYHKGKLQPHLKKEV